MIRIQPKMFVAMCVLGAVVTVTAKADEKAASKVLRHVVLFKFKDDTAEAKVSEIEKAFAALPKKIDAIIDFEWGTDNSPEGLADGFTHCFLVTFADEKGRETYLPHPDHKAFVKLLKPHLDKVLVVDYWASK
ncbi:MAG: Dabb family protein [Pirellulales bacterium]|nr:Dabb family protein [Pirellulales bacterium]